MPEYKHAFKADLKRYYSIQFRETKPSLEKKLKFWITNFGLHCTAIYRLGQFSRRLKKKNIILGFPFRFLHLLLNYLMKFFHHVDIDPASIGPGFIIAHVGTIYFGEVKIGDNFLVFNSVSIGPGGSKVRAGVPTIGNNVWVGTGSVIYGNITIGDNVVVVNGSILSRNVPNNCLVAGNPGRILMRNNEPEQNSLSEM